MPIVVNSSPSVPPSINALVLLAYKRCGLLPVEATLAGANLIPKLEHGRQLLDLIVDNLVVHGFNTRVVDFFDLQLVAGESQYTLPDSVLDVVEDAMFIGTENPDTKHTTSELICKQANQGTWQALTAKGSTSTRPQLFTVFRTGSTPVLKFWPVPSEAGTMRLKTVRHLGGNSDGTKNPDLQRYWLDALVWCLAYYIAMDSSLTEKAAGLKTISDQKKAECVKFAGEHTSQRAMVMHSTQWSR